MPVWIWGYGKPPPPPARTVQVTVDFERRVRRCGHTAGETHPGMMVHARHCGTLEAEAKGWRA